MASSTTPSGDSPPIVIPPNSPIVVSIIGSGQYGRSLAARLRRCVRAEIRIGSRSPGFGQYSLEEAVSHAHVVFLAVPAHKHAEVTQSIITYLSPNTIVVDVSNHPLHAPPHRRAKLRDDSSIAERLQKLMPGVTVVKGFNTLSAYALGDTRRTPSVYFATDSTEAVDTLTSLCFQAGLVPVHAGELEAARELEATPHRLFKSWRSSVWVTIVVFTWWVLYNTYTSNKIPGPRESPTLSRRKGPLKVFMSATAETSITLFALTFLPGPIAGLVQLARGTASRPFSKRFGKWLDARKELGVVAFSFASMHGCAGAITAAHLNSDFTIVEHANFIFGILSYALFAILAVSSLPSIAETMSWNEFRAIFSWVGTAGLIFGVLHQGLSGWILHKHQPAPKFWAGNGVFMPSFWLGIILPLSALFVRFLIWSPCITQRLRKLRNEISVDDANSKE